MVGGLLELELFIPMIAQKKSRLTQFIDEITQALGQLRRPVFRAVGFHLKRGETESERKQDSIRHLYY